MHAEHDAIINLPCLPRKHHTKKVDIVIVKTSKTGCLGNSKPCLHCLAMMQMLAPKKGYRIDRVFYSNEFGHMVCYRLEHLLKDPNIHVSKYYRFSGNRF